MMKTWGRQYRFLFFYTLISGLIVPLLAMLNLVYLCLSRNIGDYDSQFYNLIYVIEQVLNAFFVLALPGIALLSTRYSFKACAAPVLFVIVGELISEAYTPFMSYYSALRYGFAFRGTFSLNASYFQSVFSAALTPVIVYFLGLWMKRLLKGRVTRAFFTLLSLLLFATSLNAITALLNWFYEKNKDSIAQVILSMTLSTAFGVSIMAVITAVILLIFRFKIPTDDILQRPQEETSEEQYDALINDR